MVKGKRSSVCTAHSRQLKLVKSSGKMSSSMNDKGEGDVSSLSPTKVTSTSQVSLVNKGRPRRKMVRPKPMVQQDPQVSGNNSSGQHNKSVASLQNGSFTHKVNYLSFIFSGIN